MLLIEKEAGGEEIFKTKNFKNSRKKMDFNNGHCSAVVGSNINLKVHGDEEFKKYIVKELAIFWLKLQTDTGINCLKLWFEMQKYITKKITTLLTVNDLPQEMVTSMQLSAVDWLVFDLVLVHENMSVINLKKLPQCIFELFELVMEYKVEELTGDELAEAWIRLTLDYNKGGRQCSPMLLQLRWYELKELSRKQVYKPCSDLDKKTSKLLYTIAIIYQNIVTQPYPKWETLVQQKRVILTEQFVKILNLKCKWTNGESGDTWYLQTNPEIYDIFRKPDKSTDNVNEFGLKTAALLKSLDKFSFEDQVIHEEKSKLAVPRKITNGKLSHNKKTMQMNLNQDINQVLQETNAAMIDLLGTRGSAGVPGNNDDGTKSEKDVKANKHRLPRRTNMVKNRMYQFYTDNDILDDDPEWLAANKKKRRKKKSNTACPKKKAYNTTLNCVNFDPKLLKDTIVYTKKLDAMNAFKHTTYDSVSDKKMIECAILESKPSMKHKHVSKNKFVDVLRGQQSLYAQKTHTNHCKDGKVFGLSETGQGIETEHVLKNNVSKTVLEHEHHNHRVITPALLADQESSLTSDTIIETGKVIHSRNIDQSLENDQSLLTLEVQPQLKTSFNSNRVHQIDQLCVEPTIIEPTDEVLNIEIMN